MSARNVKSLIAGLLLVVAGGLFLAVNLTTFRIDWWLVTKTVFPVLFMLGGGIKLWRYVTWPEERTLQSPASASLLSGLFWFSLGTVLLLDIFGVLGTLGFVGLYWPVLIILFGIGKIVDYYRFKGGLRVRPAEIFGVVFVIVFGLAANRLSRAHFPLFEELKWGDLSLPIPAELEKNKFEFPAEQTIPLGGASELQVHNLYGDVEIVPGDSDTVAIRLIKTVRADTRAEAEETASAIQITTQSEDGHFLVGTNREAIGQKGKNLSTHFRITVPPSLPVVIENSFGDVKITGREAPCSVTNSYGGIEARDIRGDLRLATRYQAISVQKVDGNVTAENRRAPVRLKAISGSVDARTDYDEIRAEDIGGKLTVTNHFGSINLADLAAPVEVDGTGSQVSISRAHQTATIQNSHKDVNLDQIDGNLLLQTSYSKVDLKRTLGEVDLKVVHSEVNARNLDGGIKIQGRGSQITLKDVRGKIGIETSLRRVSIENFAGPVTVENEYGEVNLGNDQELAGPVKVSNRNGAIVLSLPKTAGFQLSAQSVDGQIVSDFNPTPEAPEGGTAVLEASVGNGGPAVELQTTYSRIQIVKRG